MDKGRFFGVQGSHRTGGFIDDQYMTLVMGGNRPEILSVGTFEMLDVT